MARRSLFTSHLGAPAWFAEELRPVGWFADDLLVDPFRVEVTWVELEVPAAGAGSVAGTLTQSLGIGVTANAAVPNAGTLTQSLGIGVTANTGVLNAGTLTQSLGIGVTANTAVPNAGTLTQSLGIGVTADAVVPNAGALTQSLGLAATINSTVGGGSEASATLTASLGAGLVAAAKDPDVIFEFARNGGDEVFGAGFESGEREAAVSASLVSTFAATAINPITAAATMSLQIGALAESSPSISRNYASQRESGWEIFADGMVTEIIHQCELVSSVGLGLTAATGVVVGASFSATLPQEMVDGDGDVEVAASVTASLGLLTPYLLASVPVSGVVAASLAVNASSEVVVGGEAPNTARVQGSVGLNAASATAVDVTCSVAASLAMRASIEYNEWTVSKMNARVDVPHVVAGVSMSNPNLAVRSQRIRLRAH